MINIIVWALGIILSFLLFSVPSGQEVPDSVRNVGKQEVETRFQSELNRLLQNVPQNVRSDFEKEFDGCQNLFSRYLKEKGPGIDWSKIEKLPSESIRDYDSLPAPSPDSIQEFLSKLVVVKLNGGLGTSMGCQGPKSVIAVRGDLTFLDLTVQQIENLNKKYNSKVPLVLMNSFSTNEDTQRIISKYQGLKVDVHTFQQSRYPRISKETLLPIARDLNIQADMEAWYPPGHGDFYQSFSNSGLLKKLIDEGREYVFLSNIDNLGATVDVNILSLLLTSPADSRPEFLMELTDKTKADVKGGTLIQYEDRLRLLEIAQVPKDHVEDFKSVKMFKLFNTNNLWIKLDAIDRVVNDGSLNLEVIVNPKKAGKTPVLQLETAVGSGVKCFQRSLGVNVPRSRFLPVKKTSDLLLVMSSIYTLDQGGALVMSPQRLFPTTPPIKLGDAHYSKVTDFQSRFHYIPDILELDHLTVTGDVNFGKSVSLKGTVIIIADEGDRIDIPPGAHIENKIVTGDLRIMEY